MRKHAVTYQADRITANAKECIYRSNESSTKRKKKHVVANIERPEPVIPKDIMIAAPSKRLQALLPQTTIQPPVNTGWDISKSLEPGIDSTNQALQVQSRDSASSEEEPSPLGFGETNSRTDGKEFYGPAATLAFLLELRFRARAFRRQISSVQPRPQKDRIQSKSSLVNLMDAGNNEFVTTPCPGAFAAPTPDSTPARLSPGFLTLSSFTATNEAVEKGCIARHFNNLHIIYSVPDKASFLARCNREKWSKSKATSPANNGQQNFKFAALYNAVVAVGALISGEDILDQSSLDAQSFWEAFRRHCNADLSLDVKKSHLPRELAKVYFTRAKFFLGDFFEGGSLETQQTLFLLSVFCQYALKPHSCYMYNGMAIRTAMAMGSASLSDVRKNSLEAIGTWWCMYYHEIEVCSLLGRETVLRDPEHYPVFLAKFGDPILETGKLEGESLFFARSNTELARIMRQISETIYHTGSGAEARPQNSRFQAASYLDIKLLQWRQSLNSVLDLSDSSLIEKEDATKRKIILQLRESYTISPFSGQVPTNLVIQASIVQES